MNKIYQDWLKSSKVSIQNKNIMKKMSPEMIDNYFSDQPLSFGTAGIRSTMGPGTRQLNEFVYTQLVFGYAKYLLSINKKNLVIVGHDNRKNSDKYCLLVAKILSSFGIKVLLFNKNNLMPTPIISYAIRKLKCSGGIIITASHNPKNYNGFKVYNPDGGQILPDVANKIQKLMPKNKDLLNLEWKEKKNLISYLNDDVINSYFIEAKQAIVNKKILSINKKYPIVFTGHHGTSCKLLPKFMKLLKFNIKPYQKQCFYNSDFVNSKISNPEDIKSFDDSIKYANSIKSDFIIGIDPDADRMAALIKKNNIWILISGNEMGIIFTYYKLKHLSKSIKNKFIISSYVSNNLIDNIAKQYSCQVYRTGTGFKWMGALLSKYCKQKYFVLAFEEAIGALCTTINRDKDSFTASALASEIYYEYKNKGMDFIDILEKEIYPKFGYWFGETYSHTFKELNWKSIIQQKMEFLKKYKRKKIGTFNIKKILWNTKGDCLDWILDGNSWIRFRASGTEPKFKIYFNLYGKNKSDGLLKFEQTKKEMLKIIL